MPTAFDPPRERRFRQKRAKQQARDPGRRQLETAPTFLRHEPRLIPLTCSPVALQYEWVGRPGARAPVCCVLFCLLRPERSCMFCVRCLRDGSVSSELMAKTA